MLGKKRRKRRTKEQRNRYVINYTIGNVSKRTGESRQRVAEWLPLAMAICKECHFCNKKLKPGNFAVDHVIPISRGGSRLLQNCTLICQPCNRAKGDLRDEEFSGLLAFLISQNNPIMMRSVLMRLKLGGGRYRV